LLRRNFDRNMLCVWIRWFNLAFLIVFGATRTQSHADTSSEEALVVCGKTTSYMNWFITVFAEQCSVFNTKYESWLIL
jgi:hypothetical protein